MPKTRTKTRVASKTSTRILIGVTAIALMGLAAYGYSYGYGFITRLQTKIAPPPVAVNVVEVSPEASRPIIMPKAENEPLLARSLAPILVSLKSSGSTQNVKLFSFSATPLQQQEQFGDVTIKQLVYSLTVTRGLKLSKFSLAGFSETATSLTPLSIVAYRATGTKQIFHVGKGDSESIISVPKPDVDDEEFIVVVTAKDKEFKLGNQNTITLSADVELVIDLAPQSMSVKIELLTDASLDKVGGYLWNNRKYGDNVFTATPADPNIYYLMQSVKPVDNETSNLKPDYLRWCPSIFSDSNATAHKAVLGSVGGSNDWFCMKGSLLGFEVKFIK
ncbi:hypothetical protein KKF59_02975 [Patescibacteria group bacterium]|nr:hypothetical protein [Patescibacteria group bacterium]MBU1035056.1 hypothetical protein [Patescibacteria group bacterium]MBU1630144.1 hypothetical protein [Patescibacteria group bacterium]MBU1908070.1 hypothetical protein [Patescibacteria group bacterium]